MIGGALGDAIGAPFENQTKPEFFVPAHLSITDDTQLTLATCEAILDSKTVDSESIAARMADWFRNRRVTGLGSSTLKALTELSAGGHWAYSGAQGEKAAGNGAANRIAPLVFFLDPHVESDRQTIRDVSRITHRNDEAYVGALAVLLSIKHARNGNTIDYLISQLPDSAFRDRLIEIKTNKLGMTKLAERHPPSGYVVDSVPLSILAFVKCADFLETIKRIIECGGDTDTTAAIFGNIYGATYGIERLPLNLANRLPEFKLINELATKLSKLELPEQQ